MNKDLFRARKLFLQAGLAEKIVLIVDDRPLLTYFWTIPWTLYMLGPEWRLQILSQKSNKYIFEAIVEDYALDNVFIDTLEDRYGYGDWIDTQFLHKVQFMLSKQFWQGVRGERVLIVQDHGVPVRRWDSPSAAVVVQELFKYAYAGAPWSLHANNISSYPSGPEIVKNVIQTPVWPADPGGNGGFSYRKRSVFLELGVDIGVPFENLLANSTRHDSLGTEYEDWVWGRVIGDRPFGTAPKLLENMFSSETLDSLTPLGVHNYYHHHSWRKTRRLVHFAMSEFFSCHQVVGSLTSCPAEKAEFLLHPWSRPWDELLRRFPSSTPPNECF